MSEPARKLDRRDEENYWNPQVVEGGGEGDGKPQGDLKSVDLEKAEKATEDDTTSSDNTSEREESSKSDKPNKSKGLVGNWKSLANWKKYASFGGIAAALLGGLILFFFSLIPLKLQFIITNIEQKVAAVPQYAVERRLEYLTTDYLLRRVGARTAASGDALYLGNSFTDTLYTNWKAAQYEKGVFKEIGLDVERVGQTGRYGEPASWKVTSSEFGSLSPDGKKDFFNSKEMRRLIKDISIEDTKSHQVIKRYFMRRVLRKKHNIRKWRVFEGTRENIKGSYLDTKKTLYKTLVRNTLGLVSERTGDYLACLLDGGNACTFGDNDANTKATDTDSDNDPDRKSSSTIGDAGEELLDDVDVDTPRFLERMVKTMQKFALKKALGYFVAGVGLLETISAVDEAISSGAISAIIADRNTLSYVGYASTFMIINDQITSGEDVSSEDIAAVFEILEDFEESPLYQAEFGGLSRPGTVTAAGSIVRDCNGDGVDEALPLGELVCPNKKVIVNAEEDILNSPAYAAFHAVVDIYDATVGGIVGVIYDWVGDLVNWVVGDVITNLMEAIGLDKVFAASFEFLMNWIFGVTVTGLETGGDSYDAIRAGVELDSYMPMNDRQYGSGGMYLSDEQVLAINEHVDYETQIERQNRSLIARLLSTDEDSLLTRVALSAPSSLSSFASSVGRLPLNVLSTAQNLFAFATAPQLAVAQSAGFTSNPFNIVQTGYPLDTNPEYIETDIDLNNPPATFDFDMPPDVLWEKYGCEVYVSGTPEEVAEHQQKFYGKVDGIPFEVQVAVNPCMLEKVVSESAGAMFGGSLGDGVNNYIYTPPPSSSGSSEPSESTVLICDPDNLPKPGDPPCVL